jgi:hypothetical protein
MEQAALAGLTLQERPEPTGRTSVSITVFATPGPVLVAVMVKPMGEPACTMAASAVFTRASDGSFVK